MKTGIVTAYSFLNYGNRLQNYAMHTVLSGLGLECETLVPRQPRKTKYRKGREAFVRRLYDTDPADAQIKSPGITKQIRFGIFEEEFAPVRQMDTICFQPGLAKDYRWIVTGGDGVWNPGLQQNLGKMENQLLAFAKSGQRVCMAPSIGVAELPDHMREMYHAQWNRFPWLNAQSREDVRIIREITGREAQIMPDPILLVEPEQWEALIRPLPDFDVQEPYCLVWGENPEQLPGEAGKLLEEVFPDGQYRKCCLGSPEDPVVGSAGPSECLYLLKHAGVLVTDSYYGAAFAVLLGRPFIYIPNSRSADDATLRVKDMLALLEVPYQSAGDCMWSVGTAGRSAARLLEGKRAVELLKKMFRLHESKSEQEVSHP